MRQGLLHTTNTWLSAPRHGWELVWFLLGALVLGALALGMLVSVPQRYRKTVVMVVTFIAGLYLSLEFLVPPEAWWFTNSKAALRVNPLTDLQTIVGQVSQIVWSFALLLGVWNLFQIHGRAVGKRTPGWYNSAAFFAAFFSIVIVGLLMYHRGLALAAMAPTDPGYKALESTVNVNRQLFRILFNGFMLSLESTMFSLIAFYIVSAAYRAFRIRSTEAALMMVAAAIIMLALVPVGAAMTNWLPQTGVLSALRLEKIGYWLLTGPNMAAQRAIAFGVAVGSLAMGLRIWLSLEKGSFFDRQL